MAPMALFASWLRPTDRLMLKWTNKITCWSLLYTQHCLRRVMKLRWPKSESFLFKDTKVACAQLLNLPHQQASHFMIYSFSYRSKSSSVNGGPKVGGAVQHTRLDQIGWIIWIIWYSQGMRRLLGILFTRCLSCPREYHSNCPVSLV